MCYFQLYYQEVVLLVYRPFTPTENPRSEMMTRLEAFNMCIEHLAARKLVKIEFE